MIVVPIKDSTTCVNLMSGFLWTRHKIDKVSERRLWNVSCIILNLSSVITIYLNCQNREKVFNSFTWYLPYTDEYCSKGQILLVKSSQYLYLQYLYLNYIPLKLYVIALQVMTKSSYGKADFLVLHIWIITLVVSLLFCCQHLIGIQMHWQIFGA